MNYGGLDGLVSYFWIGLYSASKEAEHDHFGSQGRFVFLDKRMPF